MSRWPADNQTALLKFYGTPGPQVEAQLVNVIPPFQMYYDGKPVRQIKFHKKAAGALAAALQEIWDYYGHDQKKIDALGISKYAGAYNPRFIRGSSSKWSNHAYGAAIDLNAEDNGFGKGKGTIPQPVINAFKRQGARWGGDYKGRTDPMHFEFCDAGQQTVPPFVKPAGLIDPPNSDADSDGGGEPEQETAVVSVDKDNHGRTDEIQASADADTETRTSWVKRKWKGLTGTITSFLGIGGVGWFDWRIIAALSIVLFVFSVAIVLFMGPGDVRAWVRKQVS